MDYFITNNNIKIYYKISGEGKPIIFIHGFTATHDVFRIPQKVLSSKYKVISYDLPGHGLSSKNDSNISIDRLALDLREIIDHLKLDNIVMVGWSLGGAIILDYIKQFGTAKLSKICLIDMSPKVINDKDWQLGLYHGKYTIKDANNDLKLIKSNWMRFGREFIKNMAPYFKQSELNISLSKIKKKSPIDMYSVWESLIMKDYRSMLKNIEIPTLILFGENSTLYSIETAKYIKENIVGSYLEVFENCTHLLILENPIKFNRVLDQFITK